MDEEEDEMDEEVDEETEAPLDDDLKEEEFFVVVSALFLLFPFTLNVWTWYGEFLPLLLLEDLFFPSFTVLDLPGSSGLWQ